MLSDANNHTNKNINPSTNANANLNTTSNTNNTSNTNTNNSNAPKYPSFGHTSTTQPMFGGGNNKFMNTQQNVPQNKPMFDPKAANFDAFKSASSKLLSSLGDGNKLNNVANNAGNG